MKKPTTISDMKESLTKDVHYATPVTSEQISARAYEIWIKKGCTHGFDVEDWLEAEQQLQTEMVLALDE